MSGTSNAGNSKGNGENNTCNTNASTSSIDQSDIPRSCEYDNNTEYRIKWILWKNEKVATITQNHNGPCPLLAIFNLLLLTKRIKLPTGMQLISSKQLIDQIGELMLEDMPTDLNATQKINYEKNISDAIVVFPKLLTGIDVNVKFENVSSFEFTSELAVFDLLNVRLYHGWISDPQDTTTNELIHKCSYNQLIDKIITSKESSDENLIHESLIIDEFLNSTKSQITHYGIVSLLESQNDHEMSILFRNNHFLTLCKHENALFTLVTDQGFLNKGQIVWESLSSVLGDTYFTNGDFCTNNFGYDDEKSDFGYTKEQQMENDLQFALSLQNNETLLSQEAQGTFKSKPINHKDSKLDKSDHDFAKKLQQQFEEEARQRSREPNEAPPSKSDTSNTCVLL